MRIALFQAYLGRNEKPLFPLGVVYLGSFVDQRDHIEVFCVDLNVQAAPLSKLASTLQEFQPDVVGISLRNIDTTQTRDLFYYYHSFRQQIQLVKKHLPHSVLIAGGSGFSLYAERIMVDNPELDFGIYREGEATLDDLLLHLDNPSAVAGLYHRDHNGVCYTGDRERLELNVLPKVKWDLVDLEPYRAFPGSIGVETKRGCCLSCDYCTYPFLDGAGIRKHSMDKIIESLQDLVFQHDIRNFTFVDSVFNVPRDHAREICEQMIKTKLPLRWVGWFNEKGLDQDFIQHCIEAGCIEFSFSPDGFSARTLKSLKKNLSTADIHATLENAITIPKMNVSYNFLANPPAQDFLSFFKLFAFMFRAKFLLGSKLKGFCITNLRIEPNTGIYVRSIEERLISKETDLLPATVAELRKLFYTNPRTRYLNVLMKGYVMLWSIRAWFKNR